MPTIGEGSSPETPAANSNAVVTTNSFLFYPGNFFNDVATTNSFLFHPGNLFLLTGLPLCYGAYRDYHKPLDDVIQERLRKRGVAQASGMDIGGTVASRAIRISLRGSFGIVALTCSLAVYASGCSTYSEAVTSYRKWAAFGRDDGLHHATFLVTEGMTGKEYEEYLAKSSSSQDVPSHHHDDVDEDDDSSGSAATTGGLPSRQGWWILSRWRNQSEEYIAKSSPSQDVPSHHHDDVDEDDDDSSGSAATTGGMPSSQGWWILSRWRNQPE
jgi:hypothetical protein